MIAKTKTGYGASRANYEAQLIAERLTGESADSYTNAAMQWGIDTESQARAAYEFTADATVEEVGFVDHPTIPMTGASPDGLIGDDGMLEIKCPNTATHINTLLTGKVAGKYITQMQWQMACCNRKWCDFVSFDPRMPPEMQLFIKRVDCDDEQIAALKEEIVKFLAGVADKISKLQQDYK